MLTKISKVIQVKVHNVVPLPSVLKVLCRCTLLDPAADSTNVHFRNVVISAHTPTPYQGANARKPMSKHSSSTRRDTQLTTPLPDVNLTTPGPTLSPLSSINVARSFNCRGFELSESESSQLTATGENVLELDINKAQPIQVIVRTGRYFSISCLEKVRCGSGIRSVCSFCSRAKSSLEKWRRFCQISSPQRRSKLARTAPKYLSKIGEVKREAAVKIQQLSKKLEFAVAQQYRESHLLVALPEVSVVRSHLKGVVPFDGRCEVGSAQSFVDKMVELASNLMPIAKEILEPKCAWRDCSDVSCFYV